jgi:hypothetical protein
MGLEQHGIGELPDIEPFHVAAYLKALRVSDAGNRPSKRTRLQGRPSSSISRDEMPAHLKLEQSVDDYLAAAGIKKGWQEAASFARRSAKPVC